MCKFIRKSNDWIFCKLSESEILRQYSIVHVAMETTKMSNFTCQWKSFISIFFTCEVSACELQPFSCHDLANDIYSQTAKTVFSHLKVGQVRVDEARDRLQTKTKHYNMIFSSVSYIMALTALFKDKERFLCLARQFMIWASNKDKRIEELDIKSRRKKIQQGFSSAE